MTKFLYATLVMAMVISVMVPSAFAESDFKTVDSDDLKNNPVALDILKKIENSKKQFEQSKQLEQKRNEQQKLIDEQRKLAQESLNQELQRMEKTYEAFTPRNAFAKYVSHLNVTHHGIYWDQFDYLHTKISLAREARDSVIEQGGSYSDAMKQYVKFAKMSKIEMLNIIRDLNLKHNYAQETIQSNFDVNGKLPRYENDLDAPCYGCTAKMTKIQIDSEQTVPIKPAKFEQKPSKISQLRESLSQLQKTFLESKDVALQMKTVTEMNDIVKQIHELQ